jgi:3-deoxy-D-manno-octulosonic-acid transferase
MIIYNIAFRLASAVYQAGIKLVAPWNPKARLWLAGRKNWRQNLATRLSGLSNTGPRVWMHCASLGEFEQGRPVLEKLKKQHSQITIILSFFSPSGYEVQKNYAGADAVCYLPADSAPNARAFIDTVKPALVLWVKYEYWFFYLQEIKARKLPLLLISGIFRKKQTFFRWYGNGFRSMLTCFSHFFVQNDDSAKLLGQVVSDELISVSGDTRFDRVVEIRNNWTAIQEVESWLGSTNRLIVAGSTWLDDEEALVHFAAMHPQVKLLLAPHHVDDHAMKDTMAIFPKALKFSNIRQTEDPAAFQILIIDNIGMLSRLYHYGTICYVGGGFTGDGVHNVLEAAVYAKPVVHGPEYEKYAEAAELLNRGGSFAIESELELEKILNKLLVDEAMRDEAGQKAGDFVQQHAGASYKILSYIQSNRLLSMS